MVVSTRAINIATAICHRRSRTIVRGSVIMKKTKSWYIGPVIGAILQHILRRNRQERTEREWPQGAALRLQQEREADATDVRALKIDHAAADEPGEQRLCRHAGRQRHGEPRISADDVIADLRGNQHERDQKCDQVPWAEARSALPPARDLRLVRYGVGHSGHRFGSVMVWN